MRTIECLSQISFCNVCIEGTELRVKRSDTGQQRVGFLDVFGSRDDGGSNCLAMTKSGRPTVN